MTTVTIRGEQVLVTLPEGQTMGLGLDRVVDLLHPSPIDAVFPDGVKRELSDGSITIWVHQTPPRLHGLKWVAGDSPSRYGPGTRYRTVRLALPYVIVLAVFARDAEGRPQLTGANECFFRNAPLESLDDPLCYPALLNCSKFDESDPERPLSWICTQNLRIGRVARLRDDGRRMRRGLSALLHCLFETGFNYSSDDHEVSSWYTESRGVDPRIATVESWEEASLEDRTFVLELPWLPVGKSVREVVGRILRRFPDRAPRIASADDVARLLANYGKQEDPK